MKNLIDPDVLTKMFEPSKERLIKNARTMMLNAQDPWFKSCLLYTSPSPRDG